MRKLRDGLYQGDFSDFHLFKSLPNEKREPNSRIDLGVHVGTTAFVPPGLYAIHFPMYDDTYPTQKNDWTLLVPLVYYIADVIRAGKRVLINCDAGISRSVVLAAMVISILDVRPMDDKLMYEIALNEDLPPHQDLWKEAAEELAKYRQSCFG